MALEWILPVTSALVGISGVAGGAYPTNKSSQDARANRRAAEKLETDRANREEANRLRNEKRERFVQLLDAIDDFNRAIRRYEHQETIMETPPLVPSFETTHQQESKLLAIGRDIEHKAGGLNAHLVWIMAVGSPSVREIAQKIRGNAANTSNRLRPGTVREPRPLELLLKLGDAMGDDLGFDRRSTNDSDSGRSAASQSAVAPGAASSGGNIHAGEH